MIYTRTPGTSFGTTIIFKTFCPLGGCPVSPTIDYYVTLTDSYGDGWNGNVLAFKQTDQTGFINIQTFTLASGRTIGPLIYTFKKLINVQIIVNIMGSWSEEIGFIVRTFDGAIVFQRNPGMYFYANNILGTFCPGCLNLSPINIITS